MFTIDIIYKKQQATRPEREKTMNVSSTISALNKVTADLKQLSDSMSSAAGKEMIKRVMNHESSDSEQITPDQLIKALDILTHSYNQMNGAQFTAAMADLPYNDVLESSKHYWLEKFQIMRKHGWCRLWSSVGGQFRTKYATGILKFYNDNQTKKESK